MVTRHIDLPARFFLPLLLDRIGLRTLMPWFAFGCLSLHAQLEKHVDTVQSSSPCEREYRRRSMQLQSRYQTMRFRFLAFTAALILLSGGFRPDFPAAVGSMPNRSHGQPPHACCTCRRARRQCNFKYEGFAATAAAWLQLTVSAWGHDSKLVSSDAEAMPAALQTQAAVSPESCGWDSKPISSSRTQCRQQRQPAAVQ